MFSEQGLKAARGGRFWAVGLLLALAGCAGEPNEASPESPRPTASLRGGVRGELSEAEKAGAERREREHDLLDDSEQNVQP